MTPPEQQEENQQQYKLMLLSLFQDGRGPTAATTTTATTTTTTTRVQPPSFGQPDCSRSLLSFMLMLFLFLFFFCFFFWFTHNSITKYTLLFSSCTSSSSTILGWCNLKEYVSRRNRLVGFGSYNQDLQLHDEIYRGFAFISLVKLNYVRVLQPIKYRWQIGENVSWTQNIMKLIDRKERLFFQWFF